MESYTEFIKTTDAFYNVIDSPSHYAFFCYVCFGLLVSILDTMSAVICFVGVDVVCLFVRSRTRGIVEGLVL